MLEIPAIWRIRGKERGTLDPVVRSIYVLCSKPLEQIIDSDGTLSPRSQWLLIVLAEEVGGVDEPILCDLEDLKYLWPDVDLYQEGIRTEPPNELNLGDLIMKFAHTNAEFPDRPMEFLARIVFHGWERFLSEKISSILSVFL